MALLASTATAISSTATSTLLASGVFSNGTFPPARTAQAATVATSWAPVPMIFQRFRFSLEGGQTDIHGFRLDYPNPFNRGIDRLANIARYINTDFNTNYPSASSADISGDADSDWVEGRSASLSYTSSAVGSRLGLGAGSAPGSEPGSSTGYKPRTSLDVPPQTPPALLVALDSPTCLVNVTTDPRTNSTLAVPSQVSNCMEACYNLTYLFQPTTFATCMQLAAASMFVQAGRASVNLTTSSRAAASALAFDADLRTFNGTRVVHSFLSCSVVACRKGKGSCSEAVLRLDSLTPTHDNLVEMHSVMDSYCEGADSLVNEDIAGPGVLMSYIFQTGIALLFCLLAKVLTSLLRPFFYVGMKIDKRTRDSAWKLAVAKQNRLALTRGNAAVISSMVEFQEVQGYFVAAIQVATLVTFRSGDGPDLTAITSFGSLMFNMGLVQVLAVSGTLPVLLTQCCLQRAGMRWWYTLAISTLVFVLGTIVDNRGGYTLPPFETVWQYFKRSNPIAECGGNPSPLVYCTGNLKLAVSDDFGQSVSYFVLPSLLVDQVAWCLWRRYAMERKMRRWERNKRVARIFRRTVWPAFWYIYWLALQVILILFTSIYFYNLFMLVFESTLLNDRKWTYGQLVAVMVWAPILGKYFYFNVFGIEEGFGRRLAKHYKVIHNDVDSDEEFMDDDDALDGHNAMEQGVEMKPTPSSASSATLPGMPSPTVEGTPQGTLQSPLASPTSRTPGRPDTPRTPGTPGTPGPPFSPQSGTHLMTPFTPLEQDHQSEGVTTAGGVVIAVENHEYHGR